MKTLELDPEIWTGYNFMPEDASSLCSLHTGKMCCMGIYANSAGLPKSKFSGHAYPSHTRLPFPHMERLTQPIPEEDHEEVDRLIMGYMGHKLEYSVNNLEEIIAIVNDTPTERLHNDDKVEILNFLFERYLDTTLVLKEVD